MNINEIINTHDNLKRQLRNALATMERSEKIREIREAIIENQRKCPHFSNKYNWAIVDDTCPYCGFHFATGGELK